MRTVSLTTIGLLAAGLAAVATGCEEATTTPPDSLQAPVAMEVVDGEVCLPRVVREDSTIGNEPLPFCSQEGNGFGLVVNQRSGRLGVAALGQRNRQMVNLDRNRPGVSHIRVGDRPVDVTTTGGDTAAIVANEAGESLTGVDLWTLQALDEPLEVEGTPRRVGAFDREFGSSLVVLATGPDRLEVRGGLECGRPAGVTDRRDHDPAQTCQFDDVEPGVAELPGRPVDMEVDEQRRRAQVVYRDRSEMSWLALDEEGLGEDEACIAGGVPPCEVERLEWESPGSADVGATAVEADPLGLFVYVLDRPNNRLYVVDRQRRQLVDASEAIEPPLSPLETRTGIPLVRSAMAMDADLSRRVLDEGLVRYRFGVRVAANNGELYRVGVADVDCRFEADDDPISDSEFFFDPEVRGQTAESECLEHLPEFPLGLDPDFDDDQELMERRVVEPEEADVALAVTPIFGLRDAEERDGTVRRPRCEQPQAFVEALAEADDGEGVGCATPLAPQPVGLDVEDDLEDYDDEPRADLITFARAMFEEGEPTIERSVFDLRTLGERWSVTYEGELPRPGDSGAALISGDEPGLMLSGGTEYCSAGVESGDRLTIRRSPVDDEDCEVFEGDDPLYRTWEVDEVRPHEIELSVLEDEDDRVDELPTRECFDQGLTYRVRPDDQWLVSGRSSGVVSRYEADGDRCVLRDGADQDRSRIQSRVETGEEFVGPYLRFRLREGTVEPERDLQYTFEVTRNFARDARRHVPDDGRATMPAEVQFTPDLGDGRLVTVVDAGGERMFIRNLTRTDQPTQFVR